MFKHVVWISAVAVALCAALFSVTGVATLFSAKFWAAASMMTTLEIGKLVTASYLYRWWNKTPTLLKVYSILAVVVLMFVTSVGIYGYLSSAYAEVAAVPQNTLNQISFADTRQNSLNETIQRLQVDNATINSRQSQAQAALDNVLAGSTELSQRSAFANLRQEIADLDVERQTNNARMETAITERDSLENAKVVLNASLNTNSDIGPFIYIARTLNMPLDTVVKWFVLILIFVFDPLAVSLILAYNNIVMKEMAARGEEIDETKGFMPFKKKKVEESRKEMPVVEQAFGRAGLEMKDHNPSPTRPETEEQPSHEGWVDAEKIARNAELKRLQQRTDIVTGSDAETILEEMENGTPDTEQRIETIRRADALFSKMEEAPNHKPPDAGEPELDTPEEPSSEEPKNIYGEEMERPEVVRPPPNLSTTNEFPRKNK